MNFHISVNLIFVSAPALYYQSYFSGLGLGNHLHIKVQGVPASSSQANWAELGGWCMVVWVGGP